MTGLLKLIFRTSEAWLAVAGLLGSWLASRGVIPEQQWNSLVMPLLVYIFGRITSKAVKAAIPK